MSVPHDEHYAVLKDIVSPIAKPKKNIPNPEPFVEELLTELPNASLQSIKKKLEEAIAERSPYTHLHILAHGGEKIVDGVQVFQLILSEEGESEKPKKIDAVKLAQALAMTGIVSARASSTVA